MYNYPDINTNKAIIMSSNLIKQPYEMILDPTGGGGRAKPVANGKFYVGEIDKDPIANPRTDIAYKDESGQERSLTSPLTLNNSGAFVVSKNDGTIIQPYMKQGVGFSVLIQDARGRDVYSDMSTGDPGNITSIVSSTNLISNPLFEIKGSVTNPPDSTARNYSAGDELFDGMFAAGNLTGVTYVNGQLNGSGQLYTDVFKSEKQKLSTSLYVASIADSSGIPSQSGASFVDNGDYWRVTFDMSDTFSVKFEQGSVATRHEVGVSSLNLINANDFGLSGEVTEVEFLRLQGFIVKRQLKNVNIVFESPITYTGAHVSLVTLSNLSFFKVSGLVMNDITSYSGAFDITRVFDISDTKTVDIECDITSTLTTVEGNKRGICPIRFYRGDKFIYRGNVNKCYEGWVTQEVKHIDVAITALDTRYPNHAFRKNGIINIEADCEGCRRDVFIINGCVGGSVVVNSKDQFLTSIAKHYVDDLDPSPESSNIDFKFKVRDSGRYPHGDRTSYFDLEFNTDSSMTVTETPAKFRNINITYDVADSDRGSVIGLRKLLDESSGDTVARGYILQNIKLSGRYELGAVNSQYFFNWRTGTNWKSGDLISDFDIKNLTVVNRSDTAIDTFNPERIAEAVNTPDSIRCDNFTAPTMYLSPSYDYDDKLLFTNTTLRDYTTRGASRYSATNIKGSGWLLNNTDGVFKIGKIDNYRCVVAIEIRMTANYPEDGLTGSVGGRFIGNLVFTSAPPAVTNRVAWITDIDSGVTVSPTITVNDSGEVFVNLPEWSGQEIHASFDVTFNYNQYDNAFNSSIRGLISNKFKVMDS